MLCTGCTYLGSCQGRDGHLEQIVKVVQIASSVFIIYFFEEVFRGDDCRGIRIRSDMCFGHFRERSEFMFAKIPDNIFECAVGDFELSFDKHLDKASLIRKALVCDGQDIHKVILEGRTVSMQVPFTADIVVPTFRFM